MVPPVMNDKILSLPKGWVVVYNDSSVVVEGEMPWSKVKKRNIRSLSLKWKDKYWTLAGKESYLCFRCGYVTFNSAGAGDNTAPVLAERCIGYYDDCGQKVIYRVNDLTGVMRMEVREG